MPSSGDAHIDFTEEVTPDKGSLNKLAKTFIPFILLFLTKAGYLINFGVRFLQGSGDTQPVWPKGKIPIFDKYAGA